MTIYFCIYFFLLIMSIIELDSKNYSAFRLYMYVCFSIFMIVIAGFRTMGFDYEGYLLIYNSLQGLSIENITDANLVYVEPLYAILNLLYPNSFQTVIFIMATLNIIILFPFIHRYSAYPFISLLLYSGMFMYSGMMGLMRQSLAISISLWAVVNYNNRRFWWYLLFAIGFHYSVVIIVLIKLLGNKLLKIKTYLEIIVASIVSNLCFYKTFVVLCILLPAVIAWKLNNYIIEEAGSSFGLNIAVIIRVITFSLALNYCGKNSTNNTITGLFINAYFLSLIVYIGFGFLPQMASRGAIYFHYYEIFLVPIIIKKVSVKWKPCIFSMYAAFSLWRHIEIVTTYSEWYVPYKNILF